jgi:hypothetical protein
MVDPSIDTPVREGLEWSSKAKVMDFILHFQANNVRHYIQSKNDKRRI